MTTLNIGITQAIYHGSLFENDADGFLMVTSLLAANGYEPNVAHGLISRSLKDLKAGYGMDQVMFAIELMEHIEITYDI